MKFALSITMLALSTFLCGCAGDDSGAQHLATVNMQIGSKKFEIEVAHTDKQREIGLMFRDSMPANHGMLFVFDDAQVRAFWMKNTRIPLDIIYIGPDKRVVSIKQMEAFDLRPTSSEKPAQYALELNQGAAKDAGVSVGDLIDIPPPPMPTTSKAR